MSGWRDYQRELNAITRRQAMVVIKRADLDDYELRARSYEHARAWAFWCFFGMAVLIVFSVLY